MQSGKCTVTFPHEAGKVPHRKRRDGHMGMVRHGTNGQDSHSVPGRHRTKDSEPNQIVADSVENEAMIGRSLIAVVQDVFLKQTSFHNNTN